jgi:hypothetical protein
MPRHPISLTTSDLAGAHISHSHTAERMIRRMLYAGSVPGHQSLFARIVLVHHYGADRTGWRLLVRLHGPGNLTGYGIHITCGDEGRAAVTDTDGEADFEDSPATWIICETAPDLHVTIR